MPFLTVLLKHSDSDSVCVSIQPLGELKISLPLPILLILQNAQCKVLNGPRIDGSLSSIEQTRV